MWTLSTQLKTEFDTSACSFTHVLKQSIQQLQTDWTDRELSPQALPTQLKTEFYTSICSFTYVYIYINFVIFFSTYALKQSDSDRLDRQGVSWVTDLGGLRVLDGGLGGLRGRSTESQQLQHALRGIPLGQLLVGPYSL